MGAGDEVRLAVFFGAVALVYALAAVVLGRRVWRRIKSRPFVASRGRRWFERGVLGLAALGVGCGAWGLLVEPNLITVTRVRITSSKLVRGTRPIRIVHLTDLHCDAKPRLEERLPSAVAAQTPDLIVFTGDAVNSTQGAPVFQRLMGRLSEIAPTFGVDGNWDVWVVPGYRYHGTGAERLNGRALRVSVAGVDVWVAGVSAGDERRAPEALAQVPPGALTLFLYHYPYPDVVPEPDRVAGRVDLMLAGHVHGGQVALPFYGAIVTLSKHGKRYEHGLYDLGAMKLFVSRGIGMEGGTAPRIRFCAPPEIGVIEIAPPE